MEKCGPPAVSIVKLNANTAILETWPRVVLLSGLKQLLPGAEQGGEVW